MKTRRCFVVFAVLASSLATTLVASADVIPFTPKCPPGQVIETHHGGSFCVGVPPKNCPAGWMGVNGTPMSTVGNCVLHTCEDQGGCSDGLQCKPADLCIEERTVDIRQRSSPVGKRIAFFTSDLCNAADAGSTTCKTPAKCRPSGVCLPKNVAKAAPRPANGRESEGAGPRDASAATPTPSATASTAPSALPTASTPATAALPTTATPTASTPPPATDAAGGVDNTPKDTAPRGGCSGCNLGASPASLLLPLVALAASAAIAVVRRRRRS